MMVRRLVAAVADLDAKIHLTKAFWAIGKLRCPYEKELIEALAGRAVAVIDSFDPQGVATLLHAHGCACRGWHAGSRSWGATWWAS